jgi:hypothetical protein
VRDWELGGTYPEESSDTDKNYFYRREWLRTRSRRTVITGERGDLPDLFLRVFLRKQTNRTWTIGSNQAIDFSSPLLDLLKACACVLNMFETASGLLLVSSCVANGWVSKLFTAIIWYSIEAALNIAVKFSVGEPVIWSLVDILGIRNLKWEEHLLCLKTGVDVDHQLMNAGEHSLKDKAFPRSDPVTMGQNPNISSESSDESG